MILYIRSRLDLSKTRWHCKTQMNHAFIDDVISLVTSSLEPAVCDVIALCSSELLAVSSGDFYTCRESTVHKIMYVIQHRLIYILCNDLNN